MRKRRAVIFDCDGVLAENRNHFSKVPGSGGWQEFYNSFPDFEPIESMCRAPSNFRDQGYFVIILTNRPLSHAAETAGWLVKHEIYHDLLLCRPVDIPSQEWKQKALKSIVVAFDVMLAIEDCPAVLPHYWKFGIPAVYIHSGYYDKDIQELLGAYRHQQVPSHQDGDERGSAAG